MTTKNNKKSVKRSKPSIAKKSMKSFAVYFFDYNNNKIRYLRYKTSSQDNGSIYTVITFVNNFKDASKFINSDSAKKTIQSLQKKYTSITFKYIDSSKI